MWCSIFYIDLCQIALMLSCLLQLLATTTEKNEAAKLCVLGLFQEMVWYSDTLLVNYMYITAYIVQLFFYIQAPSLFNDVTKYVHVMYIHVHTGM